MLSQMTDFEWYKRFKNGRESIEQEKTMKVRKEVDNTIKW